MTDKILFVQSPEELIGLAGELAEAQEHIGQITVEEFQTQFDRNDTFLSRYRSSEKGLEFKFSL